MIFLKKRLPIFARLPIFGNAESSNTFISLDHETRQCFHRGRGYAFFMVFTRPRKGAHSIAFSMPYGIFSCGFPTNHAEADISRPTRMVLVFLSVRP
jgi:hypothetical protein